MPLDNLTAGLGLSSIAAVVLAHPFVHFIGLLGLCAAYLQGGIDKLLDFPRAVAEAKQSGLKPATPIAVATIVTELSGSAMILTGQWQWFGALWLAVFTRIATFVANRFWQLPRPDRFSVQNSFFEPPLAPFRDRTFRSTCANVTARVQCRKAAILRPAALKPLGLD